MENGISEKGLCVNHKVKIVNLLGGTSEKILEKLGDIIKEKPGDLIVHIGTNDITNNVKFSSNVKKILNKISKESPYRRPSSFHLSLTAKTRPTSRKP